MLDVLRVSLQVHSLPSFMLFGTSGCWPVKPQTLFSGFWQEMLGQQEMSFGFGFSPPLRDCLRLAVSFS